jgi:tetratricopeptide (TPR) repeat protein
MQCANCGAVIAEGTVFCPSCGHRVGRPAAAPRTEPGDRAEPSLRSEPGAGPRFEAVPGPRREPEAETFEALAEPEPEEEKVSGCRWLALTGLFTMLFLVIIVGLGALGIYHGLQDQSKEKLRLAQDHYQKALTHQAESNYDLASAELEEALRLNPSYVEAENLLRDVKSQSIKAVTPTPDVQREMVDGLGREARAAYDRKEWVTAIEKLESLRALDPIYRTDDQDTLLFWSYYNDGLDLVGQGRMQEAIHRFDQALELDPNSPDATGQRHLASLYATGLGYWEADWPKAIGKLRDVYQIEANYRDVRQRLHDAHVSYGDYLVQSSAPCDAAGEYRAALEIVSTGEVAKRAEDAAAVCGSGPVPTPGEGGTVPPGATPIPVPSGAFVGELTGYEPIASPAAHVRGRVIDKAGNGVPNVVVRIQAFDWSAFATTSSNGEFGFEAIQHELDFSLILQELIGEPLIFPTKFGQRALAEFVEQP